MSFESRDSSTTQERVVEMTKEHWGWQSRFSNDET